MAICHVEFRYFWGDEASLSSHSHLLPVPGHMFIGNQIPILRDEESRAGRFRGRVCTISATELSPPEAGTYRVLKLRASFWPSAICSRVSAGSSKLSALFACASPCPAASRYHFTACTSSFATPSPKA